LKHVTFFDGVKTTILRFQMLLKTKEEQT